MADIALANVTTTCNPRDRLLLGRAKMSYAKVEFGNATLTYPSGGVPLAAASAFGMQSIDVLSIYDAACGNGYIYKYDKTNHKVRIYYPRSASAVAASSSNQPTVSTGSTAASACDAATPTVTIPAGFRSAVDSQAGVEVTAASFAPAATVLYVQVWGR